MARRNKTQSELTIDALMSRKTLSLRDITRIISDVYGKEIFQFIGILMDRLINGKKWSINHLIDKKR